MPLKQLPARPFAQPPHPAQVSEPLGGQPAIVGALPFPLLLLRGRGARLGPSVAEVVAALAAVADVKRQVGPGCRRERLPEVDGEEAGDPAAHHLGRHRFEVGLQRVQEPLEVALDYPIAAVLHLGLGDRGPFVLAVPDRHVRQDEEPFGMAMILQPGRQCHAVVRQFREMRRGRLPARLDVDDPQSGAGVVRGHRADFAGRPDHSAGGPVRGDGGDDVRTDVREDQGCVRRGAARNVAAVDPVLTPEGWGDLV